jgi:hypothetical protein
LKQSSSQGKNLRQSTQFSRWFLLLAKAKLERFSLLTLARDILLIALNPQAASSPAFPVKFIQGLW